MFCRKRLYYKIHFILCFDATVTLNYIHLHDLHEISFEILEILYVYIHVYNKTGSD